MGGKKGWRGFWGGWLGGGVCLKLRWRWDGRSGGIGGGFRIPGEDVDGLVGPWEEEGDKFPLSEEEEEEGKVNAIVWHNGRAYTLRIILDRKPVCKGDIKRQLNFITSLPPPPSSSSSFEEGEVNIALLSWRHERTTWASLHSQLLSHAPNLSSFKKLYSAALSIALEPPRAVSSSGDEDEESAGLAELLEKVRHGASSINRHADATFSIVSFGGGGGKAERIGLCFDHTPADCCTVIEFSKLLSTPAPYEGAECTHTPEPLTFKFPASTAQPTIPPTVQERIPRKSPHAKTAHSGAQVCFRRIGRRLPEPVLASLRSPRERGRFGQPCTNRSPSQPFTKAAAHPHAVSAVNQFRSTRPYSPPPPAS
ncbi:hypothetical protein L873DRAFT_919530 [Choiromyces venosus 120613-1]|uniref:Choline/carnitine acyltransferase domain-containing protein n=1 Tax=Choiromyces venosus 120613-1 TaxID=1336337 RepID=A0A3N4JM72_9PEZI|nr:hypothetical protein L873DRAFT_919530 [Choiromyces venosus 120613-1]